MLTASFGFAGSGAAFVGGATFAASLPLPQAAFDKGRIAASASAMRRLAGPHTVRARPSQWLRPLTETLHPPFRCFVDAASSLDREGSQVRLNATPTKPACSV